MKNLILVFMLAFNFSAFALETGDFAPTTLVSAVQENGETTMEESIKIEEGKRYIMLEFMSIYCRPCIANMPVAKQLSQIISDTTTVKTIIIDRNIPKVMEFIDENESELSFPILLDAKRELARAFKMKYTPTTFILDENGEIIYKHIGMFDQEAVEKIISLVQ